eukprot:CAMPEP_0197023068 /NCGR_PEP_ID=MMETSP1384-20130603/3862_1 /TAXON_ID=29189 /ORGANISM="Ammonia sp." /LENGTH=304 /DNA_ID=CAMNT_0042451227 /DNA_START=47 /DNA_END=961 /DNA_ORIENTATION=+
MSGYGNQYAYNRGTGYNSNAYSNNQFYQPSNQQISVASFADAPMTFIATSTANFMQRHYVMTILWALGLLIVTMGRGYTVDDTTEFNYNKALDEAERIEQKHVSEAYVHEDAMYQRYYRSKGWFSCDAYCQQNYQDYIRAQKRLKDAKELHNAAMSEARAVIGIFSDYAVSDARRLFWDCWEWGKNFAKRITWYDAIFLAIDSRNESIYAYFGRMIIRVLVNFTIGFISALFSFVWQLWWFVRSYKAGIMGLVFFVLGSIAAFSMIASAIGAMYVGTAGAAAVVVNMAAPQLEAGRRRRRVHYQ